VASLDVEHSVDVAQVVVHRTWRDEQAICDLSAGQALGGMMDYVQLAWREPSGPALQCGCLRCEAPVVPELGPKGGMVCIDHRPSPEMELSELG
jgi:hypothetical protein